MKQAILLLTFLTLFSLNAHTHGPVFKWACSVSKISTVGVTEEVLNVVMIPEEVSSQRIFLNSDISIRFEKSINPLDNTNEYSIIVTDNYSNEELVSAYGEDNMSFGLKLKSKSLGSYCVAR